MTQMHLSFIILLLPAFSVNRIEKKYHLGPVIDVNARFVLFAIHPGILF